MTFHVIAEMGKVHQQLLCCDKQPDLQRFIIKSTKHFKGFTASYAFYIPYGQSCNTMLPLFGNVFTSTDLRPLNQERLPHVRHDPQEEVAARNTQYISQEPQKQNSFGHFPWGRNERRVCLQKNCTHLTPANCILGHILGLW